MRIPLLTVLSTAIVPLAALAFDSSAFLNSVDRVETALSGPFASTAPLPTGLERPLTNGERLKSGRKRASRSRLVMGSKRAIVSQASLMVPGREYEYIGCVTDATCGPSGCGRYAYTTLENCEALCSARAAEKGQNVFVIQNENGATTDCICSLVPVTPVTCDEMADHYHFYTHRHAESWL